MRGLTLYIIDKLLSHLHINFPEESKEGIVTTWQRTTLLIFAITLHNIPEGLVVGVAFGAVKLGKDYTSLSSAIALAIGNRASKFS